MSRLLRLAALVLAWWLPAGAASAHEVRPALLQIVERAPGTYDVTWKQPAVGDLVLRLNPRLSSGALAGPPTAESLSPGFRIRVWRVRGGAPLDGQTVEVEGLAQSLTDVIVRVTTADGRTLDAVIRPSRPSLRLELSGPAGAAVPTYLRLGVEHILGGVDHLLFVLGLLLLIGPGWPLVKAITAFTAAHSVTLALAALGYISFPAATIEALVALSILFLAVELARPPDAPPTLARRQPWLIAFAFGLLHGMAFAGALAHVGLPAQAAPQALFLFNAGVEIGQLGFIGAVLLAGLAVRPIRRRWRGRAPRWAGAAPVYGLGGLSAYWLIERALAAVAVA